MNGFLVTAVLLWRQTTSLLSSIQKRKEWDTTTIRTNEHAFKSNEPLKNNIRSVTSRTSWYRYPIPCFRPTMAVNCAIGSWEKDLRSMKSTRKWLGWHHTVSQVVSLLKTEKSSNSFLCEMRFRMYLKSVPKFDLSYILSLTSDACAKRPPYRWEFLNLYRFDEDFPMQWDIGWHWLPLASVGRHHPPSANVGPTLACKLCYSGGSWL